jgi:hypothetical protein
MCTKVGGLVPFTGWTDGIELEAHTVQTTWFTASPFTKNVAREHVRDGVLHL